MSILILIAFGVCFSTSILFLVLYVKMKRKWLETDSTLQKSNDEIKKITHSNSILREGYNTLKKGISTSDRIGYYESKMNLLSIEDKEKGLSGDPYSCYLYVKEIDRYTNGMSKIELTNVELIYGFNTNQFEHVKNTMRNKFSSIRKTTDIEWLESEDSLKEIRRKKLEKITSLQNEN
jgi:hypothetical protein